MNFFYFFINKKLINKIFENYDKLNIEILTAEYSFSLKFIKYIYEFLGMSYHIEKYPHKKIIMFYSSLVKSKRKLRKIKKNILKLSLILKDNLQIGLGTIAIGIFGNEPILSTKNLDRDLLYCKKNNIDTVVIFRLDGLNKSYLEVI